MDSLLTYRKQLLEAKVTTEEELNMLTAQVEETIVRAYKAATDLDRSPRADLYGIGNLLERTMYSQETCANLDTTRTPETLLPLGEDPRTVSLASRSRSGLDEKGTLIPEKPLYWH